MLCSSTSVARREQTIRHNNANLHQRRVGCLAACVFRGGPESYSNPRCVGPLPELTGCLVSSGCELPHRSTADLSASTTYLVHSWGARPTVMAGTPGGVGMV